jgi:hypothetical protein
MARSGHHAVIHWIKSNSDLNIVDIENGDIETGDRDHQSIILLRNPYNWFASWLASVRGWRSSGNIEDMTPRWIELWKKMGRDVAGETSFLSNATHILYDNWFSNNNYRSYVASELGLGLEDHGLLAVVSGSTWDGVQFNGRAQEMDVLNRWKILEHDEYYRRYMLDDEISDLSRKIFNFKCPLRKT